MQTKASFRYQLNDFKKQVMVYYFVLVLLIIFLVLGIGLVFSVSEGSGSATSTAVGFSGIEFGTIIFLFVCGLNSFREAFRMLIQNGSSRRRIFAGRILAFITVSIGMAFINTVVLFLGKFLATKRDNFEFSGLYELMYPGRAAEGALLMYGKGFLLNVSMYLAIIALGYFIRIAYYRMNKAAKIAVSIGVPSLFIYGLPMLDATIAHGAISEAIYKLFTFAFGMQNGGNAYFTVVSCLITACVLAALSWLMMRRAVIKD